MSWPPRRNAPAPQIDPRVQQALSEIFGRNPYGEPLVRLVWGQQATTFYHEAHRLRYPAGRRTVHAGWGVPVVRNGRVSGYNPVFPPTPDPPSAVESQGKLVVKLLRREWIGVDRWFVEQWIGPNVACQNWDEARWEWRYDPVQGIHRRVDMTGPAPIRGMYGEALYCIAEHSSRGACCRRRKRQGYMCYGRYRDPDQRDVDHIARLKRTLDAEAYLYSYDELPPREVIEQDVRDSLYRMEQRAAKGEQYLAEMLADEIRPHTARLLEPGGRLDKEKYKDFGPAIKKLKAEMMSDEG